MNLVRYLRFRQGWWIETCVFGLSAWVGMWLGLTIEIGRAISAAGSLEAVTSALAFGYAANSAMLFIISMFVLFVLSRVSWITQVSSTWALAGFVASSETLILTGEITFLISLFVSLGVKERYYELKKRFKR